MDDIVLRGMAKWPNVPEVYGWLALDRRGNWLLKGEPISRPTVNAFIGRNYEHDARGRWFFQNGPQRVFVALGYTPHVYRITDRGSPALESHTGRPVASLKDAWIDEEGSVLLLTDLGPGLVHDHDLDRLLTCFIDSHGHPPAETVLTQTLAQFQQQKPAPLWLKFNGDCLKVEPILSSAVPRHFGFDPSPVAMVQEACP